MLCWFLPNINMNQPQIYICPLPLTTPSCFPLHPTPGLSQSPGVSFLSHTANSHWLSISHMVMYMFPCYSLHSSHPFLCAPLPCLFSMSESPLLPCKQVHSIIFLDSIYMHKYTVFFFLFLTYFTLCKALGSFTSLELTQMCSFSG